ncbi:MAG: DUF4129 domain-containing protein [Thermoanaerobaculia bacterium]
MSVPGESFDESPTLLAIHHVVVPAAMIVMITSLLFYLVDVRSAFLGGGPQLKWIGFCFVMGTVLTERYGRSTGDSDAQGCYTLALAGAMVAVLLVAPWDTGPGRPEEKLANVLIIAIVWRFATRVTRGLSPESGARRPRRSSFFGVDRLTMEAWQRQRAEITGAAPPPAVKEPAALPKNPAVSVAWLAGVALAAFALGEPVLLRAAPQTGVRALAAVIVFLFSTGLVLAAASSMDSLRRAERAGGRTVPSFLPWRMALAAGLMALLLSAGLGIPGLEFRGSGLLRPPLSPGRGEARDRGFQEGARSDPAPPDQPEQDELGTSASRGDTQSQEAPPVRLSELRGPAASLLQLLTTLGKMLIVPLALVLIAAGIWALFRLWPRLKGWGRRLGGRWRAFLQRIAAWFTWTPKKRSDTADPLARLEELAGLPPRESVLAAYQRFLILLERLGSPRPEKATPYEVMYGLPAGLRLLEDPVRTLTELYVHAAYSGEPPEHGAREQAISALVGMRILLKDRSTAPPAS